MRWNEYTRKLGEFHQQYDLLLTPTMAMPPARIGQIRTPDWQLAALRVILALRLEKLLLASNIVEQMVQMILALKAQGVSILLSEQNMHFAELVSDRAYVLEKGQIRYQASMQELAANEEVRRSYLSV